MIRHFQDRAWRGSLLTVVLLVGGLACGRETQQTTRVPAGTPVILISIDTLRSDRLPAYGYGKVETPAIDSFRQDAILFARAYSHIPFTLPSHISMLTGLLPAEHGVRDNVGYSLEAGKVPYLPRLFNELGYRTAGTVSAYVLHSNTGLGAGWDHYDDTVQVLSGRDLGGLHRPGGETLQRAVDWLESVKDEPFFLFFHIYEPHTPYEAPEPFASRYSSPYDAEVAAADAIIGRLLQRLKSMGLYERAVILLLSDHGEGLMDHGDPEHNLFVYREVMQVPLMLKLPGDERAGSTVETPVQLIDVFPTLVELLGLERPEELQGTSLLQVAGQDGSPRLLYGENLYPRIHFGWSELASIIEWPYHFIDAPEPELYDLVADPGETRNILRDQRRVYRRLKAALEHYDLTPAQPQEVDPETRERLAALGYVGGPTLDDAGGPRPDPKEKLPVFTELRQAFESFADRDFELAVERFQRLTETEPQMVSAWQYLGRALRRLGRNEEALASFEEALTLSGGAPEIARGMADLLLEMGHLKEAREHALLALPTHEIAHEILAEVALRQGDLEEADKHSQEAVAKRGGHLSPLITRARVLLEKKEFRQVIALTRQAEEEFGDRPDTEALKGLFLVRGRAYAELGEAQEAIQAFRRQIELTPDTLAPYTHLALVYGLLGQGPEAGKTLQQMVEAIPTPHAYAEAIRTLRLLGDPRSASLVLRDARRRWPQDEELREL